MTDIIIDVLIALATVVAIAILMGTLLALVTHFFSVKESRRKLRARACLPGVNCGACGFKGCDDYASALAEGKAAPNLCVPGGEDTAKAIGEDKDIGSIEKGKRADIIIADDKFSILTTVIGGEVRFER